MKYIYNFTADWADEFDVTFSGILSQEAYNNLKYAQSKLPYLRGSFYFGTNEGWDNDFDYLDFGELIPVSNKELEVLQKFGFPNGLSLDFEGAIENEYRELNNLKWDSKTPSFNEMIDNIYEAHKYEYDYPLEAIDWRQRYDLRDKSKEAALILIQSYKPNWTAEECEIYYNTWVFQQFRDY